VCGIAGVGGDSGEREGVGGGRKECDTYASNTDRLHAEL